MKHLLLLITMCLSLGTIAAQEYSLFHGTWFNAMFIDALRKTSSVEQAMAAKGFDEPLYVRIDSTNLDGKVTAGYGLGSSQQLLILKTSLPKVGMKWAIGTIDLPMWIVSIDERSQTYISLTKFDSLEGKPIVLGKLPSKNPDPMFMLKRMVNASVLSGQWVNSKGATTSFTTNMEATMNGNTFPYDLSIDSQSYSVTLTSKQGKPVSYIVQRMGDGLTLTPMHGSKVGQQPIALKRKTP
ncbi:MAG: hypothetical protein H7X70_03755 [Candidatus Kapabacteria bacterium]|nr:hypothetical protein [Candidatus Kapabacteria bacterium]